MSVKQNLYDLTVSTMVSDEWFDGVDVTLQTAQDWLKAAKSPSTIHFRNGAEVFGQMVDGRRESDDWSRNGANETIQEVEIQMEAKKKKN